MNSGTSSSSALAQTGWNFGSENASPLTLPPIAAPFSPCFLPAVSSSCTARSGACSVSEAKPANRSGLEAQSSASFSFWILTTWPASSRSRLYQLGLIDSTSMSTACASMAASRLPISTTASSAPLTGDGGMSPSSLLASRNRQWAWTSMVLTRLPLTVTGSFCRDAPCACADCSRPQLQNTIPVATAALPPFRKLRRVVMTFSHGLFYPAGRADARLVETQPKASSGQRLDRIEDGKAASYVRCDMRQGNGDCHCEERRRQTTVVGTVAAGW